MSDLIRFTITDDRENQINGSAVGVAAVLDACWAYLQHHGAASVVARYSGGENAGAPICSVSCEIHE